MKLQCTTKSGAEASASMENFKASTKTQKSIALFTMIFHFCIFPFGWRKSYMSARTVSPFFVMFWWEVFSIQSHFRGHTFSFQPRTSSKGKLNLPSCPIEVVPTSLIRNLCETWCCQDSLCGRLSKHWECRCQLASKRLFSTILLCGRGIVT